LPGEEIRIRLFKVTMVNKEGKKKFDLLPKKKGGTNYAV
jgi:hypothetical protein